MPAHPPAGASSGRRGRRPGQDDTRQAVLEAARARFAAEGYTAATIRKIAADAGVDAALVIQFFRSKDELFAAVMSIPPAVLARMDGAWEGPEDTLGERVARAYLGVWEGAAGESQPLLAMLRSAIAHEAAADQLRGFLESRLVTATGYRLPGDHGALLRVSLASSMLVGVIVARHVIKVPAIAGEDLDTIVTHLAPALQSLLSPAVLTADGSPG
jgi:AcrR family transcriptional regulator